MNATVTCEKCGKPLGIFNGKICYECEKKAHEDFKRYCTENNYVPLTTEMYSRAIKAMDVLDKIRAEIERIEGNQFEVSDNQGNRYTYETIEKGEVLQIIDKYR